MSRYAALAGFLVLTLGTGLIGSFVAQTSIDTWYRGLAKPPLTPPDWVFPAVWTVLYVLMAVAAWRVWLTLPGPGRRIALVVFVLQLALKVDKPEGIWAAQTWCAMVDTTVPPAYASAFAAVVEARDKALALITERGKKRRPLTGGSVDDAARGVLVKAGFGDQVMHRTGHSIDTDLHGSGPHLDSFETQDTRRLLPGVGFSVEPGVYLTGRFGVRSEINVYMRDDGPEVTPTVPQLDLIIPA